MESHVVFKSKLNPTSFLLNWIPELWEGYAVGVEEDEVGDEEGVGVGEPRDGPRRRYLLGDGVEFEILAGKDLRAGVELGGVDALQTPAGEVLNGNWAGFENQPKIGKKFGLRIKFIRRSIVNVHQEL